MSSPYDPILAEIYAAARELNAQADEAAATICEVEERLFTLGAQIRGFLGTPIVKRRVTKGTLPSSTARVRPYQAEERTFLGYSTDAGRWGLTVRTEVWNLETPADFPEQVGYQLLQTSDRELRIIAAQTLPLLLRALHETLQTQLRNVKPGGERED